MSGLRVLITNFALAERTGSEMYVHDLSLALAARGHTPLVYTPEPGPLAARLPRNPYSITRSARRTKDGGKVSLRARAVLRLTTSWNFSARCTGRSPGLAPLRILPT